MTTSVIFFCPLSHHRSECRFPKNCVAAGTVFRLDLECVYRQRRYTILKIRTFYWIGAAIVLNMPSYVMMLNHFHPVHYIATCKPLI